MGEAMLYQLHSLLAATALGFCRLAPTFYLLPFFASGNIPTVVRHPIIIVVSCALVQHYHYELSTLNEIDIAGNDSNLLIVFYVQIMPDDFVMQLHRF